MNWLLFLVLIAGLWNVTDASISIASSLSQANWEGGLTPRSKLEFVGRLIRGIFGWMLVIVAWVIA